MKLITLKKDAKRFANYRGHQLTKFHSLTFGKRKLATAHCILCGRGVMVNESPLPNEINIGGEAVAVSCYTG